MTASLVGNVSLLALAAAALIGCYAQSPVISRHETEPPREATAAPARWISVRGSSNEGVALPNGRLVLILGERALVDAAGTVTLAREPTAPLDRLMLVRFMIEPPSRGAISAPPGLQGTIGSREETAFVIRADDAHACIESAQIVLGTTGFIRADLVHGRAEGGRLGGAATDLACTFGLP